MYQKPDYLDHDSEFVNKIERDSNICNSCYRKIREHTETRRDIASSITEYENDVDFAYFDDFKQSGRPNSHEPYCVCGAVDWQDIRVRPIDDAEEIQDIAYRLSSHLSEKGVKHSESTLVNYIEQKYNLPAYQDRIELVFEEAVDKATENI